MLSPYGVLGLAPGCSEEQLRAAYKRKVLETHPDKGGSVDSFRKVQTAYEALVKDLPKLGAAASFTPASFTPPKTSFPFARTFDDIFANFAHPPAPDPAPMAAKEFGRKRRRTMEETIEMAFASIPKVMRPPNLARSAPSSARSSHAESCRYMWIQSQRCDSAKQRASGTVRRNQPASQRNARRNQPGSQDGGISQPAKEMPGGISQPAKEMPGGISQPAKEMPGGISQPAKEMPGGSSQPRRYPAESASQLRR
ncbi:unnamed protein product [Effrenium voratum]|nr:unnamed protein product [Effrenium voratum]